MTLTSQDFITKYNLKTASSVQTAVKGLMEKGILSDNLYDQRTSKGRCSFYIQKFIRLACNLENFI